MNKNNQGGGASVTPTLYQGQREEGYDSQTGRTNSNTGSTTSSGNSGTLNGVEGVQMSAEEFQKKLPIISPEFTLDYSDRMQKYVATLQGDSETGDTAISEAAYIQWQENNPPYQNELQNTVITKQSITELNAALDYAKKNELTPEKKAQRDAKSFTDTLNVLINLPFMFMQGNQTGDVAPGLSLSPTPKKPTAAPGKNPTPTLTANKQTPKKKISNPTPSKGYVYYSQLGGAYGSYLLPIQNGTGGKKCTISSAGCGPTTAAMIISSYIDSTQTPPKLVDSMGKAGVSISCNGSGMYELYGYMSKVQGLKVSSMISLGNVNAKTASSDLRNYTKGGWTLFVLAHHVYGGHYFWVTEVTDEGEILAYDPAYGSGRSAPINQNLYAPDPNYLYAFGVKKT